MNFYIVLGNSESGDEYGPFLFTYEPTKKDLRNLIRDRCDWGEHGDGPGMFGSYTYLSVHEILPIDIYQR